MCWEKQISCEKLDYNATDWPHVGNLIPFTAFQYNFWRPVLTSAYDRTMSFIEKSCSSKINYSNFWTFWEPVVDVIGSIFYKLLLLKKNILGFEIGMCIPQFMYEAYAL